MPNAKLVLSAAFIWIILTLSGSPTDANEPSRLKFDVLHYNITIEPDIPSKTLSGSVVIRFASNTANLTQVEFDCGNLEIETVKQADVSRQFSVKDHRLAVAIP